MQKENLYCLKKKLSMFKSEYLSKYIKIIKMNSANKKLLKNFI